MGVHLGFVPANVVGFLALVAGVLLMVRAVKAYCFKCKTCDKPFEK
jgi:uncharacterized integral membrane protein